jgi:DNA-binding transcriptional LysR family regulator
VSFAACTAHRLILPSPDLSIYTLLERQLRRTRGRMDVCAEVGSLEVMRNLTRTLNAVSFQSRLGLEADIAAGRLVHVPLSGGGAMITELGAYVREGRSLPAALEAFVAMLRNELAEQEAEDATA